MTREPADFTCDVSGTQPEAREAVRAASDVFARHTAPWLIGLLLHDSAFKGDFIPGCSDIDLKLYLRDEAFTGPGNRLPFELAAAIQRDLARIDPAPFQYIQTYAERSVPREGQLGPIPGAYHMVFGRCPVADATATQLLTSARAALDRLDPYPNYIATTLLQHGGGKLERAVRLACTDVWPTLCHVLCFQQDGAAQVWALPRRRAIALLPSGSPLRGPIAAFLASVTAYYADDVEDALSAERGVEALRSAVTFLSAARAWWAEVGGQR